MTARPLHVRPGLLGLVLGAGAIGGVPGALVTRNSGAALAAWWAAAPLRTCGPGTAGWSVSPRSR
jgi:hypothetical protein